MASEPTTNDFAHAPSSPTTPLSHANLQSQHAQIGDAAGSSTLGDSTEIPRPQSTMSQSHTLTPSRGGTLKKKSSMTRRASLKRTGSKRTSRPGSVKSLTFADDAAGQVNNDAFSTPVPTSGTPTEILANRFQVWRKVLKDLITYFRDLQKSYDAKSKSLYSLSNVMSNITAPGGFVREGGISDALSILRDYHKKAITEGNKAKQIEEDVIVQLTGLRSDLGQKIKEIKSLSGDFKNSVDKETEVTRRAVRDLEHALKERQPDAKGDPFLVRLGVERQLERQIEEENYLHRAFLNLESSGRELESIVMGEIQKAYSAYAGILKREADESYEAVENLQTGPLALSKDFEWNTFVENNSSFVDPNIPVRKVQNITYPGRDDPAAAEVKAGMLERKSKYLKSYTPGWYVLSPTHIHEFKSPDRISTQQPLMSLPLSDQKLGSHSNADSTSHKFMLKGKQAGGLHKSHSWVFRAESHDTMMAWFNDIKSLTEKTGIERDAFIRRTHARSLSGGSGHHRSGSISEGSAMDEDEADAVPYSAAASQAAPSKEEVAQVPQRPKPGGRFPSHLNVHTRDSLPPASSRSSDDSTTHPATVTAAAAVVGESEQAVGHDGADDADRDVVAAAADLPGSGVGDTAAGGSNVKDIQPVSPDVPYLGSLPQSPVAGVAPMGGFQRHESNYGEWMKPVSKQTDAVNAPMLQSEDFVGADDPAAPPPPNGAALASSIPPPADILPDAATPAAFAAVAAAEAANKSIEVGPPIPPTVSMPNASPAPVGTISPPDTLSSSPDLDPGSPIRSLANQRQRPELKTVDSSQIKVPGSFNG